MFGPKPNGFWSSLASSNCASNGDFFKAGERYCVVQPFADYDRHLHPAGEEWLFLGCAFQPYDDGMSWFVSLDGQQEWQIRLQWHQDEQAHILNNLSVYLILLAPPVSLPARQA